MYLDHSHQALQNYAILTHQITYFIILLYHFTIRHSSHVLFLILNIKIIYTTH